jgi:hypothetical protein
MPVGCRFHPRCGFAVDGVCDVAPIALEAPVDGTRVRCVRHTELDLSTTAMVAPETELEREPTS